MLCQIDATVSLEIWSYKKVRIKIRAIMMVDLMNTAHFLEGEFLLFFSIKIKSFSS